MKNVLSIVMCIYIGVHMSTWSPRQPLTKVLYRETLGYMGIDVDEFRVRGVSEDILDTYVFQSGYPPKT